MSRYLSIVPKRLAPPPRRNWRFFSDPSKIPRWSEKGHSTSKESLKEQKMKDEENYGHSQFDIVQQQSRVYPDKRSKNAVDVTDLICIKRIPEKNETEEQYYEPLPLF